MGITSSPLSQYFAHSAPSPEPDGWQLLAEHLENVARLARTFGEEIGEPVATLAETAGRLHDLGKYRSGFQKHIRGLPVPRDDRLHKEAGAAKAAEWKLVPVAFAVAGHHGGLPDKEDLKDLLKSPAGISAARQIWDTAIVDFPTLASAPPKPPAVRDTLAGELLTRVVFSCLVDADWTDTAEHERRRLGLPIDPSPPALIPGGRLESVLFHIDERSRACVDEQVRQVRHSILDACLAAADSPPGLFSLTVPTGGGKTLSGLAFALKHAQRHELRRIIYVAPYMSIIEQNADAFRKALLLTAGDRDLFEHYSLAEPPGDDSTDETVREAAARRAETWDAPFVVTTNVQFFESLFSNRPGACRKLHNIAGSVVLLDECQTLPPGLIAPTCGMLRQLATELGCSIVLCTATQPAFDHEKLTTEERLQAVEIIPSTLNLFDRLKRVHVDWPKPNDPPLSWKDVAEQMVEGNQHRQGLCVVNTKKAARAVFEEMRNRGVREIFHLSTAMCPAHRREKLTAIRARLAANMPCYVVSTQLIEAGVDVDFPFLMRELAPFESIIQAAGRCNREGRIKGNGGRVVVFRSESGTLPPDRWYRAGCETLSAHFLELGQRPQIDDPATIRDYFGRLYHSGSLDDCGIDALRRDCQFKEVGRQYRIIDNITESLVVATWRPHAGSVASLLAECRLNPRRSVFRSLAAFQVNIFPHECVKWSHLMHEEQPSKVKLWDGRYDDDFGIDDQMVDSWII